MKRERRWPVPFLDLSNTLFFFFVALFALALLVISEETSKAKVDTSSKLLVTMTWRDGSGNDVDLWLKLPNEDTVSFRTRQAGFASLDHDNLGLGSTAVHNAEGALVTDPKRDEVIFIRATMPGTYVVNLHLYGQPDTTPEPVTVTLVSVDPGYRAVTSRKLVLTEKHEQQTAFRFTVDQAGNVVSTDLIEELFVK
jgi:hypothetical protein